MDSKRLWIPNFCNLENNQQNLAKSDIQGKIDVFCWKINNNFKVQRMRGNEILVRKSTKIWHDVSAFTFRPSLSDHEVLPHVDHW